jgi:desumoylating isopeptidase 1
MDFLREVSPRFTQATYNVFKHNCNNFTNECAGFLIGSGIPKEIIDLPNEFLNTPLGKMVAPMLTQAQDNLKVQSH